MFASPSSFLAKQLLSAIFYMHRGYFARSVEDNKDDPLGGKYGSSVLAAVSLASSAVDFNIDNVIIAWKRVLLHQPDQELALPTSGDIRKDVVFVYSRFLMLCSYCPHYYCLISNALPDRSWVDCDQMSRNSFVAVGVFQLGVGLCAV